MVPRELLGPPDLSGAQALCIHELAKVVVVGEHKDFVFAAFQVVAPSLEGFNDSQKLLIVSLVPGLSRYHLSGEKGHRVPLTNFGLRNLSSHRSRDRKKVDPKPAD